jgi:hypothetical protein
MLRSSISILTRLIWVGPDGAVALAESPNLMNLTSLDLSHNEIGPEGAVALAQSKTLLRNLTSL